MGSNSNYYDVIIVGAGFSGIYMLNRARALGLTVLGVEAGEDIGGTWWWNNYPGARVDSDHHFYQFSDPKLFNSFDYHERFPGRDEVLRYMDHVDKLLDIRNHFRFNTRVTSATFSDTSNKWAVTCSSNPSGNLFTFESRFLLLCTGFASKSYTPDFKGLSTFRGEMYHTGLWPKHEKVDFRGKKVCVIGTGASGVQVVQEVGPVAEKVTVYQRTPNIALPMQQKKLIPPNSKEYYAELFDYRNKTFSGMTFDLKDKNALADNDEERLAFYEHLWSEGGFQFWLGTYQDVMWDEAANDTAYHFWRQKVWARMSDKKKRELVAPLKPPHPFGTKRPSLEQNFYEVLDRPNVEIIDINASPLVEITDKGVVSSKEGLRECDILVLATGFDSVTGGMLKIDMRNGRGLSLQEKWGTGTRTALGLAISGFPNMFFFYGPHAPTAFSNGPTCTEVQGEFVTRVMKFMKEKGLERVDATPAFEDAWTKKLNDLWAASLFPRAKSWYQGSNIPGKKVEPLNFLGGYPAYTGAMRECEKGGWNGFLFA